MEYWNYAPSKWTHFTLLTLAFAVFANSTLHRMCDGYPLPEELLLIVCMVPFYLAAWFGAFVMRRQLGRSILMCDVVFVAGVLIESAILLAERVRVNGRL